MAGITVRRAPYKDFLQPALQRRFSLTATILLIASYLEALLTADWQSSYFWSAFPIGPAGFRTLFIFACGLAILVLRIAHYHVGRRTLTPGAQVLYMSLSTLSTYETAFWHLFSSLGYALAFVWSSPNSANLHWVIYFGGNRARLNERPVFLMCYMGVLALLQTWAHYETDMDRLDLKVTKKDGDKDKTKEDGATTMKPFLQLFPAIFSDTLIRAIYALPIAFIVYFAILRSFAWSWTLMFFRPFYNLPKTNMAPPTWPSDLWLFGRCMYGGIMVSLLWAVGNAAFTASMAQEPLKNGKALTSESKDPNGSLLNGLKSKKNTVKAFAMWELAHIAEEDQLRRQAVYEDIDRKDGPMWSQVYAICMDLLKGIDARVTAFGQPTVAATTTAGAETETQRRSAAALQDDVFLAKVNGRPTLRDGVRKAIGQVSQSPGSPPSKQLSPLAKKTWKDAKDHLLTQEQQDFLSPGNVKGQFETLARYLVSVPKVGELFHQDFAARFAGVVLGSPFAEPTLYCNATRALCSLALHSLAEDQYGNVHRDVPSIIRMMTSIIRKVEALKTRFPLHWTDSKGTQDCPDVDMVLDTLREGLSLIVTTFEPFSTDLRLTLGDLRHAKEAAVKPEPVKVEESKPEKTQPDEKRKIDSMRNERRPPRQRLQESQRIPEMEQVMSTGRARA